MIDYEEHPAAAHQQSDNEEDDKRESFLFRILNSRAKKGSKKLPGLESFERSKSAPIKSKIQNRILNSFHSLSTQGHFLLILSTTLLLKGGLFSGWWLLWQSAIA